MPTNTVGMDDLPGEQQRRTWVTSLQAEAESMDTRREGGGWHKALAGLMASACFHASGFSS